MDHMLFWFASVFSYNKWLNWKMEDRYIGFNIPNDQEIFPEGVGFLTPRDETLCRQVQLRTRKKI